MKKTEARDSLLQNLREKACTMAVYPNVERMLKRMSVQLNYKEGVLTAKLTGEIDHHSAREMREAIDSTAQKLKPYCLRLDFSQVPFMDSSGVGLILGRVRLCGFWRGRVVLCGLSANLNKMVELAGISSVAVIERRAG